MKILLLLLLIYCGKSKLEIPNTRHEIVHTIDITPIFDAVKEYCEANYSIEEEMEECYTNTVEAVLNSINKNNTGKGK